MRIATAEEYTVAENIKRAMPKYPTRDLHVMILRASAVESVPEMQITRNAFVELERRFAPVLPDHVNLEGLTGGS